jgi:nucleotide-binding universal stress UspA family protein
VAHFLARHQVKAEAKVVVDDEHSTPTLILGEAKASGAGLIVAGGYGHTRLQEWVLGGVTRALLKRSPVCVLLAH